MREVIKTFKVYKFNDAPENVKQKIREYFATEFDLYEPYFSERITTLKKIAETLDGTLDYSLSCVPDIHEFITIKPKFDALNFEFFWETIKSAESYPFTGVWYDDDIALKFNENNLNTETLNGALSDFIRSIHDEYSAMLEDEYLEELCEANDYEFLENGKLY